MEEDGDGDEKISDFIPNTIHNYCPRSEGRAYGASNVNEATWVASIKCSIYHALGTCHPINICKVRMAQEQ
jgi:hypothetical protein